MGRELNKGEASRELSRFLCFGKEGALRGREFGDQLHTFSCLSVLHNAVVAWNMMHIEPVVEQLRAEGRRCDDELLSLTTPLLRGFGKMPLARSTPTWPPASTTWRCFTTIKANTRRLNPFMQAPNGKPRGRGEGNEVSLSLSLSLSSAPSLSRLFLRGAFSAHCRSLLGPQRKPFHSDSGKRKGEVFTLGLFYPWQQRRRRESRFAPG